MDDTEQPTEPFTELSNRMMVEAIGIVFADEVAERIAENKEKGKSYEQTYCDFDDWAGIDVFYGM